MSRIDVVQRDKGKFRVLVNFIQYGTELTSPILANQTAEQLKERTYPKAEIHLVIIEK